MIKKLSILVLFLSVNIFAADTCSRIAIINYQEVLVDANSSQKGEGLRYYLNKDQIAKTYLDEYQEGTAHKWQSAAIGSVATGLLIGGLTANNSDTKKSLMIGGSALMLINFLISRTLESSNEDNLLKAVEEYNKRNLPKIYFAPDGDEDRKPSSSMSFVVEKDWNF